MRVIHGLQEWPDADSEEANHVTVADAESLGQGPCLRVTGARWYLKMFAGESNEACGTFGTLAQHVALHLFGHIRHTMEKEHIVALPVIVVLVQQGDGSGQK